MERLGDDEISCKKFSKVCKKFFRVPCFRLRLLDTSTPDLLLDILISSPKMLSLECHKRFTNNHMKLIAESCPNIKLLNLSNWGYLNPYNPEMAKLDFDDVGLVAIANACGHLVDVNLSWRLHFKEIGIGSIVRSCKNLRKLCLVGCLNVTDKSLNMIGEATRLEMLDLDGCEEITDLGLEYLANGDLRNCLEILYLNRCNKITDNGIIHLKKLVSLTNLVLSSCGANITDYGVVALCELLNLEILRLDFLINITDISLREIGCKCSNMSELSFEGCEKITSVGLHAISDLQRLSSLTLVSCYKLSWEDIKSTVLTLQNMRCLYLSRSIKKPMTDPDSEESYRVSDYKFCKITWQ